MNLDKALAAQLPSSGVGSADSPEVKPTLEEVKARRDKVNESLAALLTDSAQTVSVSTSSAHERIDSLEGIVKDSFERLLQELESVKDCCRLQKEEQNLGELVAVYSPGRPQRLKSERVMQDVRSVKQTMSKRRQQEQLVEDVVVMVAPTQQPSEQCRQLAEASVIEVPCQAAQHPSPAGSASRPWPGPVPSLNATVCASPPVPKPQSSTAGAWSPGRTHQTAPASQFPCRAQPQITSPRSRGRTPTLDARLPIPWPQPQLPQQASQEQQQAQPPMRPVGSTTSPATAAMIRARSMDAHAAPLSPSTATANAALLTRAELPARTPQIQSPRELYKELSRETTSACGVRSPSTGPSRETMAQPLKPTRSSLGSVSKAVMTQCQSRRSMSGI